MTIAELFVNLGVKGSQKALQAVSSVKNSLMDVSAAGLAAKAAVAGVVYGLERLIVSSAQMGTNFQQFANFTGLSTDQLQRWQYAMLQSGVATEETQAAIVAVQGTMGKMLANQGAPSGFGRVNAAVGLDWNKLKDTYYVMDKLRTYLKGEKNVTIANMVAESFGLTPAMIQALRTSQIDLAKISNGQIPSAGTNKSLDRINIGWMNFKRTIDLTKAGLTAEYGGPAIKTLSAALKVIVDVVHNIDHLLKSLPILKDAAIAVGLVLAAVFAPVTTAILGIIVLLSEFEKSKEKKQSFWKTLKDDLPLDALKKHMHQFFGADPGPDMGSWHPPMLLPQQIGGKHSSVNTTINNYGVEGADEIGQHFDKHVNFALRQMQTTMQVA